jgi:DNA-binding NarL/FixJ family response regulator
MIGLCLGGAAGTLGLLGRPEHAARFFGAAAAALEGAGTPVWPVDRADYESNLAAVRASLGEKALATAFAAGRNLPLEQAIAEVAEVVVALADAPWTPAGPTTPPADRAAELTAREREVLKVLATGKADKEVAAALGISRHTVGHHVARILTKLGVESRAAAAAHAIRHGLA